MNKKLCKYISSICKIYGVKIKYRNDYGGSYWAGEIYLGTKGSTPDIISAFCHELAHYKNDVEGKYPVYHRECPKKAIRRIGVERYSRYALKAEIYTEHEGKKLAKEWFPKCKYVISYKNTAYWKGFIRGYYQL